MKDPEYGRVIGRIGWVTLGLSLAGGGAWWLWRDARAMFSFLGGAGIAGVSFWMLHRVVEDLQAAVEGRRIKKLRLAWHAMRVLILGGIAYAILEFCGGNRAALASGLTVALTAATIEVLIELFYARA
jgi:hypothetical protein